MLYKYEATTIEGEKKNGSIEASNVEIAISSLQRRNLIIVSIHPAGKGGHFWEKNIKLFERVKPREVVILSRQLSTLFEAKVPVLDSFKLLAAESENPLLRTKLSRILEDIQGGSSLSSAMTKHPDVFSKFYVSMIRSGEESGKLDEVFLYLAEYLERSYELASKAKNALIYPAFVIATFFSVMVLMMVFVIPRLSAILLETGQDIPTYTKVVIGISDLMRSYGVFFLVLLAIGIIFLWRYTRTKTGRFIISRIQIQFPYIGTLYKKLYLSRITDNLETLLSSGIPVVRALEITGDVVGNKIYERILRESEEAVRAGNSISDVFSRYKDIPPLVSRMVRIGEESGKLDFILKTLARFYKREVNNAVENLVGLIEPVMIVALGLAVGILLVSILGPIYNISAGM
ncbi:MAG: type II secretion system F family protein [bacterium]|nr:type II secretion system F family protein [bacterium]